MEPGSLKHYPLPALMRSGLLGLIFARHAIIEGDNGALRSLAECRMEAI
jgi:hypothetical protein